MKTTPIKCARPTGAYYLKWCKLDELARRARRDFYVCSEIDAYHAKMMRGRSLRAWGILRNRAIDALAAHWWRLESARICTQADRELEHIERKPRPYLQLVKPGREPQTKAQRAARKDKTHGRDSPGSARA